MNKEGSSLSGLTSQALGADCRAAAENVDVLVTTTLLIAADAHGGRHRIVVVGDYPIYVRQGAAATVAAGHVVLSQGELCVDKLVGVAVNAISVGGTSAVNVGLQKA